MLSFEKSKFNKWQSYLNWKERLMKGVINKYLPMICSFLGDNFASKEQCFDYILGLGDEDDINEVLTENKKNIYYATIGILSSNFHTQMDGFLNEVLGEMRPGLFDRDGLTFHNACRVLFQQQASITSTNYPYGTHFNYFNDYRCLEEHRIKAGYVIGKKSLREDGELIEEDEKISEVLKEHVFADDTTEDEEERNWSDYNLFANTEEEEWHAELLDHRINQPIGDNQDQYADAYGFNPNV